MSPLFRHLSEEAPKGASLGLILLYTVTSPHQLTDPLKHNYKRLDTSNNWGPGIPTFHLNGTSLGVAIFIFARYLV